MCSILFFLIVSNWTWKLRRCNANFHGVMESVLFSSFRSTLLLGGCMDRKWALVHMIQSREQTKVNFTRYGLVQLPVLVRIAQHNLWNGCFALYNYVGVLLQLAITVQNHELRIWWACFKFHRWHWHTVGSGCLESYCYFFKQKKASIRFLTFILFCFVSIITTTITCSLIFYLRWPQHMYEWKPFSQSLGSNGPHKTRPPVLKMIP